MLTYVADAARFTECLTGRDYPLVSDEGDYEALEHAYLAAGRRGGRADHGELRRRRSCSSGGRRQRHRCRRCWSSASSGSGRARPASGRRTRRASPTPTGRSCGSARPRCRPSEGRREPNLILREGEPRFTATVGCNQILGSYTLESDRLTLRTGADDAHGLPGAARRLGGAARPDVLAAAAKLADRRADARAPRRRAELPLRSCRRSISTDRKKTAGAGEETHGGEARDRPDGGAGSGDRVRDGRDRRHARDLRLRRGRGAGAGDGPDGSGHAGGVRRHRPQLRHGTRRGADRQGGPRAGRLAGGPRALHQARPRRADRAVRRGPGPALAGGEPGGAGRGPGGHPAPARPRAFPRAGRDRREGRRAGGAFPHARRGTGDAPSAWRPAGSTS